MSYCAWLYLYCFVLAFSSSALAQSFFIFPYSHFPSLHICTCFFRTCIFHPRTVVLDFSILDYSTPQYLIFPYLHFHMPLGENPFLDHRTIHLAKLMFDRILFGFIFQTCCSYHLTAMFWYSDTAECLAERWITSDTLNTSCKIVISLRICTNTTRTLFTVNKHHNVHRV